MADTLTDLADRYVPTIVRAVRQEYPNDLRYPMHGPEDRPTPRQVHPAFYGCFDWHSAVEMHWALVRVLRLAPGSFAGEIRAVLDEHLTAPALATEAAYFDAHPGFRRPYGWGWVLTLAHELSTWDDPDAVRWAANLAPLSDRIADLFAAWLPRATYPLRDGAHTNSVFGLTRALPYARAAGTGLAAAIEAAARRWYGTDADYPAGWEPGGADFLSPALTEAELMSDLLPAEEFRTWFGRFLPGAGRGEPPTLFAPAEVYDPTDGQAAHLYGLNLYRAHAFTRLARALPPDDPGVPLFQAAAARHAAAALPAVTGSDYMVEHWLAAYAILLLTT